MKPGPGQWTVGLSVVDLRSLGPLPMTDLEVVSTLSDDETFVRCPPKTPTVQVLQAFLPRRRPRVGFRKKVGGEKHLNLAGLMNVINGRCGCTLECFKPFRSNPLLGEWITLHKNLFQLKKLEKDNWVRNLVTILDESSSVCDSPQSKFQKLRHPPAIYHPLPPLTRSVLFCPWPQHEVFHTLKENASTTCRGVRGIVWKNQPMCIRGFMKFVSIGKSRFRTIYKAAKNGEGSCPFDLRFCPRGEQPMSPKAECIHQFLTKLYEETAECLPDGINSNKRPRQGKDRFDPPEMNRDNVKHLPPGTIREYHAQCQAAYPQHTISKKLFSSVSCLSFRQHFLIFGS